MSVKRIRNDERKSIKKEEIKETPYRKGKGRKKR